MSRARILLHGLLVCSFAVTLACGPGDGEGSEGLSDQETAEYFGLAKGNLWEFEKDTLIGMNAVYEITDYTDRLTPGHKVFVREYREGPNEAKRVDYLEAKDGELYLVRQDEVRGVKTIDRIFDPPVLVAQVPMTDGQSNTTVTQPQGDYPVETHKFALFAVDSTISVPAGEFEGVHEVLHLLSKEGETESTQEYFHQAPYVGVVRMTDTDGVGHRLYCYQQCDGEGNCTDFPEDSLCGEQRSN